MTKFDSVRGIISTPVLLFLAFSAGVNSANLKVCGTKGCKETAKMFNAVMDKTVDPCDNFYKYSCANFGTFTADKHAKDEKYSWTELLTNKVTAQVKEFIVSKTLKTAEHSAARKAHDFYQQCVDTDSMSAKGLEPIRDVLTKIGLPTAFPFSVPQDFCWYRIAAKMKRYLNLDFLFSVEVINLELGDSNDTFTTLVLDRPSEVLPFMDEDARVLSESKLEAFAKAIFEQMDPDGNKPKTKTKKRKISKAVSQLKSFSVSRQEMYKREHHRYSYTNKNKTLFELQRFTNTVSQCTVGIQKESPKDIIDWKEYFGSLFSDIEGLDFEIEKNGTMVFTITKFGVTTVRKIDEIVVADGIYMRKLISFLTTKKKSEIALAMWFDSVTQVSDLTTETMRQLAQAFNGKDYSQDKWSEECYDFVERYFKLAVLQHMVSNSEAIDTKEEIKEFMRDYKFALGYIIAKADWLDNITKSAALEKVRKMRAKISHPDWLLNDTALDFYYKAMEIIKKDFLGTILKWQQNKVIKNLKGLSGLNRNVDDFSDSDIEFILTVNAFYTPTENSVVIPMAILQIPNYGYPLRSLNYGAVGATIGHEITHGFDNDGKDYDAEGEMKDWWQAEARQSYKNRSQCFIDSYSSIEVANRTWEGEATLGENIADNGGVRESILAYRYWRDELKGEELLLPEFEHLTPEQLVFLSYAIQWCEYCPDDLLADFYDYDVHSPPELRVLGPLINSEEFAEAWKCPKGSRMNPDKPKCRLW